MSPCINGGSCWNRWPRLAPDVRHPVFKRTVREMLQALPHNVGQVKKQSPVLDSLQFVQGARVV